MIASDAHRDEQIQAEQLHLFNTALLDLAVLKKVEKSLAVFFNTLPINAFHNSLKRRAILDMIFASFLMLGTDIICFSF